MVEHGRATAYHVQSPGFGPQNSKEEKKNTLAGKLN
jgi:hypothetical protein